MKHATVNQHSTNIQPKINEKEADRFNSTTSDVSCATKPIPKLSDCITANNWLRSEDIDCFGEKLAFQHASSYTYGFVPSYLYEWAAKRNFASLLTYLHMLNIKHYYSFFVPVINSLENGNHWFLACVLFTTKTIMIMDSMRKKEEKYYRQHFMNVCDLISVAMESAGGQPDFKNWKLIVDSECYQQKNDFDCGIFVCLYMYSIMNKDYGYISRLRKNRRDVVRRVIDEYPSPPSKIEQRYNCNNWISYPDLNYTYEKGSIVIFEFESTLKAIKCVRCKEKIEGSKVRCIVCGTEAHSKCLLPDDEICFCQENQHRFTPNYQSPIYEEKSDTNDFVNNE